MLSACLVNVSILLAKLAGFYLMVWHRRKVVGVSPGWRGVWHEHTAHTSGATALKLGNRALSPAKDGESSEPGPNHPKVQGTPQP